jgi:hypothetical protein
MTKNSAIASLPSVAHTWNRRHVERLVLDSEDARRRGAEAVDEARAATIKAMGGSVPPVEEFEVVASDL